MSARESGSDTWPRLTGFPRDNLELGNMPEEDDVDQRAEPPSWLSGTGPAAAGTDPPDRGPEDEDINDRGQGYAAESDQPPGFGDAGPGGTFGDPFNGYGDGSP